MLEAEVIRPLAQWQFDRIECNRCGNCCRKLSLCGSSPFEVVRRAQDMEAASPPWMDYRVWVGNLVPWQDGEGKWWYSCSFLTYEDRVATCSIHDHRPSVCYHFPYGRRATYDGCAWDVEVEEYEPFLEVRETIYARG